MRNVNVWPLIETWDTLRRAMNEAHIPMSLEQLRTMTVEQLIEKVGPAGIRFEYFPTKAPK